MSYLTSTALRRDLPDTISPSVLLTIRVALLFRLGLSIRKQLRPSTEPPIDWRTMPFAPVDDHGTVLEYEDSGIPAGSPIYTTLVLVHGIQFNAGKSPHVVIPSRR